jgi:hypothetical protein
MDQLDLVAENERLLREAAALREQVHGFERSRWWRLHPRRLLRRGFSGVRAAAGASADMEEFYRYSRAGSARSAAVVAPVVQDLVGARAVLDVGGGEGWWASAFSQLVATAVLMDNGPLSP